MGQAIPHKIGRHVHHKARPDDTTAPPAPTGINYLELIEQRHTLELADRLRYSQLPDQPQPPALPEQALPSITDNDHHTSEEPA